MASPDIHQLREGMDLAQILKEPVFKPYKVTAIRGTGDSASVEFSEGGVLSFDTPIRFSTEKGQSCSTRTVVEEPGDIPKFNLLERATKEVPVTRETVLEIWKGLSTSKMRAFLANPEGFASVFIATLHESLADHICDRLEYVVTEEVDARDLEESFPPTRQYPAKELVAGHGDRSLYDLVQKDSENEEKFIHRLNDGADDRTILYFKFPATFKIGIPRIIGNYNPDWGILRWDEHHRLKLELVRETKGSLALERLERPNERRKIECARKHFAGLGISYRHVTGDTVEWWKEEDRSEEGKFLQ